VLKLSAVTEPELMEMSIEPVGRARRNVKAAMLIVAVAPASLAVSGFVSGRLLIEAGPVA